MEITHRSFPGNLLQILKHISEAHFVSLDLELSGVSAKSRRNGKQTLEQRYQETKAAAERYQILQVGITCVEHTYNEDGEDEYILRPYNFHISPLVSERLEIDRDFTFSSSAVQFLLSHGFRIDAPIDEGVQYISRDEEKTAKKRAASRFDKSKFQDLQLDAKDIQSLAFVEETRQAITHWIEHPGRRDVLDITSRHPMSDTDNENDNPSLGGFERRLVHQLVRAEFPQFLTQGKENFVRISVLDIARETAFQEKRLKEAKARISSETGFRWVVEALARHGHFRRFPLEECARHPGTGVPVMVDHHELKNTFHRAEARLQRKRPVLVGHNCFTDVVYFYQAFIGPLPDTVAEFQFEFNNLFPFVVDTKYLATHNCGDISPRSSLAETEQALRTQSFPRILTAAGFQAYDRAPASSEDPDADIDDGPLHEAGYDSYLTALIMVRLSAKLAAEQAPPPHTLQHSTSKETLRMLSESRLASSGTPTAEEFVDIATTQNQLHEQARTPHLSPPEEGDSFTVVSGGRKTRTKKPKAQPQPSFANSQPFIPSSLPPSSTSVYTSSSSPSAHSSALTSSSPTTFASAEQTRKEKSPMATMPAFSGAVWQTYANQLRVFGTVEGICDLGPVPQPMDDLNGGVSLAANAEVEEGWQEDQRGGMDGQWDGVGERAIGKKGTKRGGQPEKEKGGKKKGVEDDVAFARQMAGMSLGRR